MFETDHITDANLFMKLVNDILSNEGYSHEKITIKNVKGYISLGYTVNMVIDDIKSCANEELSLATWLNRI